MNFCRSALLHMKSRVHLKYFVNDCRFSLYSFGDVYITDWRIDGASSEYKLLLHVYVYLQSFFVDFHQKKIVFIVIFISFFDEISNFPSRILTSQTLILVDRICQCNCCQHFQKTYYLVRSLSALRKPYVSERSLLSLNIFFKLLFL